MSNVVAFDPGYDPRKQRENIKAIKNRLWNPPTAVKATEPDVLFEQNRQQEEAAANAKQDFEHALRIDNLIRAAVQERRKIRNVARRIFFDELEAQPPKVRQIVKYVADRRGVTGANIIGQRRTSRIVLARQIVMYLASTITFLSLSEIGQCLGNRDHTTILHGVRRIEGLKKYDSQFSELLDGYSRDLTNAGV